jgi:hypothetical protein
MSLVSFQTLPDDSRLWCFGASRPPAGAETARLLDAMHAFVGEWTAHSRNLKAGLDWRDQRFLLVAVDESETGASGCSIDALTRQLRDLESELAIDFLDSTPVWYRDATGHVRSCSRAAFRSAAERGEVGADTPVFDLTITRVRDYREGRFERAASASWQRTLLVEG